MASFSPININLGTIKVGRQQDIYFSYDNVEKIIKMISPCDCANPVNQVKEKRILVRYIPKPLPPQIKQRKETSMVIKKVITVNYIPVGKKSQETILLSFTATVTE